MSEQEKQLLANLWVFYDAMQMGDHPSENKNALLDLAIETGDYDDYAEFIVLMESLEIADAERKGLPRPENTWADYLSTEDTTHE